MKKNILFLTLILTLFLVAPTLLKAATIIENTANFNCGDAGTGSYSGTSNIAKINKISPPNITIKKLARNVTRGETTFAESTTAGAGDIVEFQITLENSGEDTARWVVVTDKMPDGTTFKADGYGEGKGIKVGEEVKTNDKDDDIANYNSNDKNIYVGKNKSGTNGNTVEIILPGSYYGTPGSLKIYYQVIVN